VQADRAGDFIQSRPAARRAGLALAFLPLEPRLFNGIRARAAVHLRQVKQFAEASALRTPTLGRVVAEHLRIERLKRTSA
jgi:hypothetical protein